MKARDRKIASKNLGIALQSKYRAMLEASTNDEIQFAAIDLGNCFNENIEFIFWVLKEYGGVTQMPYQPPKKPVAVPAPANDLPAMPDVLKMTVPVTDPMAEAAQALKDEHALDTAACTCPVLEHGIIGRDKHMTSCPKFKP